MADNNNRRVYPSALAVFHCSLKVQILVEGDGSEWGAGTVDLLWERASLLLPITLP